MFPAEPPGRGRLAEAVPRLSSWVGSAAKRLFDLALALPLLAVSAPLIALLAAAIRLESPGSPFFSQERVGRGERLFLCRKLRSMRAGTPSVATHDAPPGAVTGLGRVIRRTKLDELPQLWNVVKGEMSLVGPRPSLPTQGELVGLRRQLGVYRIRPGITGLAQVSGIDMATPELLAHTDARYGETATAGGDIRLLLVTVTPSRFRQN